MAEFFGNKNSVIFFIFDVTNPRVKRIIYATAPQRRKMRETQTMNSEELNIEFLALKDTAYRYAVSLLHDTSLAQDATQDLYEKLWRRRLFIRRSGFRSLVMTSIRNICLDLLRERERKRRNVQPDPLDVVAPTEDRELMQTIKRLIEALPEREREVIHLHDYEGMEYAEVAEIIGSSESAARMACSRARQKIKEELIKVMNYGL